MVIYLGEDNSICTLEILSRIIFILLYYTKSMKYSLQNVMILSGIVLVGAGVFATMYQVQISYGFSWPHIDRSDGKAPIAVSGDNVYVTWWGNSSGNYEVMFKASDDGGQTFSEGISLSNSTNGTSVEADIATSGDNVYVTFADNKTGYADAYVIASNDNGKTFNPAILLTDNTNSTITNKTYMAQLNYDKIKMAPYELKVAADGDNVYVLATGAEKNSTSYEPDVFLKVSNDSGETFGKDINLSQSQGITSDRIHIKSIDDKVYVTWWDRNLDGSDTPLMRISEDGGQTFGDKITLSSTSTDPNTGDISNP